MTEISHMVVWGTDRAPVAVVERAGDGGYFWHCVDHRHTQGGYSNPRVAMFDLAHHLTVNHEEPNP